MLLVLMGCWSSPEPPPPPEPSWVPPTPSAVMEVKVGDDQAVDFHFLGVGSLYRGFFGDGLLVADLRRELARCITEDPRLVVTYDEETRRGEVVLQVPARALTCRGRLDGNTVELAGLRAVTEPLAAYRNAVAAAKDMRVYAFRTGLHVTDGYGAVTLWLHGQDPLDGTAYDPCIGLDGFRACGALPEDPADGVVTILAGTARHRHRLRDLLTGS